VPAELPTPRVVLTTPRTYPQSSPLSNAPTSCSESHSYTIQPLTELNLGYPRRRTLLIRVREPLIILRR